MTYYTIEPALRARVSEAEADMATIRRAIGGTWATRASLDAAGRAAERLLAALDGLRAELEKQL